MIVSAAPTESSTAIPAATREPAVRVPASATPALTAATLYTAPELAFQQSETERPEGPVTIRGLYGRNGPADHSVMGCRLDGNALKCLRYALNLPVPAGTLVEVDALLESGQVDVIDWRPVVDDLTVSQAAAQAALAEVADEVAALDWGAISRTDFAESSASFQWDVAAVGGADTALHGFDMATARAVWRAQGPNMPEQKPLVTRFPVLYVFTSLDGRGAADVFATIEGFVEE